MTHKHERHSKVGEEQYSGALKSMYMRFMLTFFAALVLSTGITMSIILSWQADQLNKYMVAQMVDDVRRIIFTNEFIVSEFGEEFSQEQFVSILEDSVKQQYTYNIYPNVDELCASLKDALDQSEIDEIENGNMVTFSESRFVSVGVFKLGTSYVVLKTNSASSAIMSKMWYSIIWTVCFATIIVALLINSFAVSLVIKPIKAVADGLREVAHGNFDINFEVNGTDEVAYLQRNFNKMAQGLKKNEEMSRNFVSTVSHEYKTPIAAITGYAQLLEDDSLSEEEQKAYIGIILEQSRRLSNLSVDMLQLSRLESGVVGLQKSEFSLDEQIRNVILSTEQLWESKDINMDIDLDDVDIMGNDQTLYHVWENLLTNAIKFTEKCGNITIKLTKADHKAIAMFSDDGCGISIEALPHIFERFYKSDAENNAGGNGLGLAISKKIVELHNGTITAQSKLNEGTTFTVTLPLR